MDDAGDGSAIYGDADQYSHVLDESLRVFGGAVQRIDPNDNLDQEINEGYKFTRLLCT